MSDANAKTVRCPDCNGTMNEVYVEANYGRVLIVDQCVACGEVWFDRWELCFLKDSALEGLHAVEPKTLGALQSFENLPLPGRILTGMMTTGSNRCPRCNVGLKPFVDPSLPPDVKMRRCPGCNGMLLGRASIAAYAAHKRKRTGKSASAEPPVGVEQLKKLQADLKTATIADSPMAASGLGAEPIDTKEVAKDMGVLLLEALARMVLKV
ncbi:MAG: zf-TFIIB domain-containing protein [Deltaproteobacteria bacterium]|nr:zf-TFIIB domain-containing protein [Deltaproteobacteria bacterium]